MKSRLKKVQALASEPGTEGERQAAQAALARMPTALVPRKRLTDAMIKTLPPPASGNRIYYDAPDTRGNNYVRGFGARVTAAGARAFILNYKAKSGREGRITIGSPPEWTLTAARERAKELKRLIDGGADPAKDEAERRAADNVNELIDAFINSHVARKRERTARDYVYMLDKHVRPVLGTMKVADVKPYDVDKLHRHVTKNSGPYRANRCIAVVSKMFNLAVRWEMRAENPCKGLERNQEDKRERFLSADERERLHRALDAHDDKSASNVIRLLAFTGARASEPLQAKWADFDLVAGVWTKPASTTKQRKEHHLPLSSETLNLLRRMRKAAPDAERLCTIGYGQLRAHFLAVVKTAGITNLRLHDLRHTVGSVMVAQKQSLTVIGAALGHAHAATTHRYAHLQDDVLRAAVEQAGAVLAGGRKQKAT